MKFTAWQWHAPELLDDLVQIVARFALTPPSVAARIEFWRGLQPRAGGSSQEEAMPRWEGTWRVSCHYNVRALSRDALWAGNELG